MAAGTPEKSIEEAKGGMEKALQSLRHDLQRVRTGRANAQLLDGVNVDYYGTPTPLNQLANLTIPDPRLIVIAPYDKGALHAIEKAIQTAQHLGLTPNNDGKVVRIPIPALTEERRKELVKQVKKMAEEHKLGVREARREALQAFKGLENDGILPADDKHRHEKKVQDLTDEFVKKIDEICAAKEKEILQV
jgi:ribosome recycling factor